jgi:hypothetical protein
MTDWLARLLAGHRGTLARAITAVENNTADCDAILAAVRPHLGRARAASPVAGCGSRPWSAVMAEPPAQRTVGVVAVDPSSGDRRRDPRRSHPHGAIASGDLRALDRGSAASSAGSRLTAIVVSWMLGKDVVTSRPSAPASRRSESRAWRNAASSCCRRASARRAADDRHPEIADVLVVTKCDLPGADLTARQLGDRAHEQARHQVLRDAPRGRASPPWSTRSSPTPPGPAVRCRRAHSAHADRARPRRPARGSGATPRAGAASAAVQDGSLRLQEAARRRSLSLGPTNQLGPPLHPRLRSGEGAIQHLKPLPLAGEGRVRVAQQRRRRTQWRQLLQSAHRSTRRFRRS